MRDSPNHHPAGACKGKHAYPSWMAAAKVRRRARRTRDAKGVDRRAQGIYRCQTCGHYHIGGLE